MPNSQANRSVKIARFGLFELSLDASELRKNGAKVRLQEQPFQVLALLLERAGDVVTREDLRQKLWPSDTFVDFDHSLLASLHWGDEAVTAACDCLDVAHRKLLRRLCTPSWQFPSRDAA